MTDPSPGAGAFREGAGSRGAPRPWDLVGRAVQAAWRSGDHSEALEVLSDADEPDVLPVAWLLRGLDELPALERMALERTRGRVLDVGAGAGPHARALQSRGHPVTALERAPGTVEVLEARGVEDVRLGDVFEPGAWASPGERWDTVLLLMNGTTMVGSPPGLTELLDTVEGLLAEGGRVLVDSVDLREGGDAEGAHRPDGRYVGEIQLQLVWRGERTDPFPVLYADPELLARCAGAAGLASTVVAREETGAYLAELTRSGGQGPGPASAPEAPHPKPSEPRKPPEPPKS